MFGNLLQRMIFWELTRVSLLSLLGLTGILLMAGIVAEASQQGLSPTQILLVIPLLIPSTLPYTIPATTLFATCVVYGRLTADNEILAIRASGINVLMVIKPALLLGLIMSGITMGLYFHTIPYTHHLMRTMVLNDLEKMLYAVLEKQQSLSAPQSNYAMYVKGVQGRKLINPTFKCIKAKGEPEFVAQAREAELKVDVNRKLLLVRMRHGVVITGGGSAGYFLDRDWEVPLPDILNVNQTRRPRDMTWSEMEGRQVELTEEREQLESELAVVTAQLTVAPGQPTPPVPGGHTAENLPLHQTHLHRKLALVRDQQTAVDTEFQMRPALALGCLCFVVIGCPVGIWFGKSDFLSSFITCFLPIVFVYYPLMLCGLNLAKTGTNVWLSVWGPNMVMAMAGGFMFWRLARR